MSSAPSLAIAGQHAQRAYLAIAGVNTHGLTRTVRRALRPRRDEQTQGERTVGDRARTVAPQHAMILNAYIYDVAPTRRRGDGQFDPVMGLRVREGREWVLPGRRPTPVFWDCAAPQRYNHALRDDQPVEERPAHRSIPRWVCFESYCAGIELVQPDGYFTYDTIGDLPTTMRDYERLRVTFPADALPGGRLWPVYPVTATWDSDARLDWLRLPAKLRRLPSLAAAIPINATQRAYRPATLEAWAAAVLANGQRLIADPQFRQLIETHGQVALGGMAIAGNPVPRLARHLLAVLIQDAFPDVQLWMLGQANAFTMNGLGLWGLANRVMLDGSWYLHEARCGAMAFLQDGLINMWEVARGKGETGQYEADFFLPRDWIIAANLFALLAGVAGLIQWPSVPLPLDPRDQEGARVLQRDLWSVIEQLGQSQAPAAD